MFLFPSTDAAAGHHWALYDGCGVLQRVRLPVELTEPSRHDSPIMSRQWPRRRHRTHQGLRSGCYRSALQFRHITISQVSSYQCIFFLFYIFSFGLFDAGLILCSVVWAVRGYACLSVNCCFYSTTTTTTTTTITDILVDSHFSVLKWSEWFTMSWK